MQDDKEKIRAKALEVGFDVVGFAPANPDEAVMTDLKAYLADGRHGGMAWMAETEDRRASSQGLWPEARSVVVLGLNYGPSVDPLEGLAHPDRGVISVYARGKEYHDLVKKRLKRLARWMVEAYDCDVKVFVDTAPVMEKPLAEKAGLGWQGKHTNLVSRAWGSWLFLGEVFTTLDLEPDEPEKDHCGLCKRCAEACPTGAITVDEPRQMDARRCISYLTIEHKGDIDPDLMAQMGNRIYGCDDCLTACPWNKFTKPTKEAAFQPREGMDRLSLADMARMTDAEFREAFRGSPVKRTGRDRMVRNALIAIGNSCDPGLLPVAEERLDDESEVVRHAARWAVERLTVGGTG